MSYLSDDLSRRLKQLDRFLPNIRSQPRLRRERPSSPARTGSDVRSSQFPPLNKQPGLTETLAGLQSGELPENAALLGACEDGLPFLLDFTNPVPGAILALGDEGSGKTSLLVSLLTSACQMNPPRRITFNVLAAQPEEYLELEDEPHCQGIFPVEDPEISALIHDLVSAVEQRKRIGPQDPALLLAIDDLAALLPFLDEETYNRLYWLIRHGPRYQVWTLACLSIRQVEQVDPRFLTAFRTRLFGYIHNERLARHLANDDSLATRDLQQGRQFLVPYQNHWLRFWICNPEISVSIPKNTFSEQAESPSRGGGDA